MAIVMFDVDGVLADFTWGFTQEAVKLGLVEEAWHHDRQFEWNFDFDVGKVWSVVNRTPWWWYGLCSAIGDQTWRAISALQDKHRLVFCTNRVAGAPDVAKQTSHWLHSKGIDDPNVIVSKRKGEVARAIDADFSIDDKLENAQMVHWLADQKPCQSYLLDAPYNREGRIPKLKVVYSVDDFVKIIGGI